MMHIKIHGWIMDMRIKQPMRNARENLPMGVSYKSLDATLDFDDGDLYLVLGTSIWNISLVGPKTLQFGRFYIQLLLYSFLKFLSGGATYPWFEIAYI